MGAGPDPGSLKQAWVTSALDGDVYGEPLVFGGHVIVATEGDSVVSLDAASGSTTWSVNLGQPVPRSALECGNIDPTGITGTPVIDATSNTIYVVAFVLPGRHDLVALDAATGAVRWRRAADPPGLDPLHEQQRSALTLVGGRVYIAYGGLFGDCGPYKGAVVSYPAEGSGEQQSWIVPTQREGGIWAPAGVTVAASGDPFLATGNAASSDPANFDDGNAVVRLHPDLTATDVWAPQDWASLSATDADLGSQNPLLLDAERLFIAGKGGTGYVLEQDHLGGIGGEVANAQVCDGGGFGGSGTDGQIVVVGCSGGPVGVRVGGDGKISVAWHADGGRSGAPILAGPMAWLVTNEGHLLALDTATGASQADVDLGDRIPGFPTPTVVQSAVIVAAGDRVMMFR